MDFPSSSSRRKDPPNLSSSGATELPKTVTRSSNLMAQSVSTEVDDTTGRFNTRRRNRGTNKRYIEKISGDDDDEELEFNDDMCDDGPFAIPAAAPSRKRSSTATASIHASFRPIKRSQPSLKSQPKTQNRKDAPSSGKLMHQQPQGHKRHGPVARRRGSVDSTLSSSGRHSKKVRGNSSTRSNINDGMINDTEMQQFVDPLVSDHNCSSIQELLHITHSLSFYKPDNYPIFYAAQLLGLTHVLLPENGEGGSADDSIKNGLVSVPGLLARLKQKPAQRITSNDQAFAIPPIGNIPDHIKFWGGSCYKNNDEIWLRPQEQQQASRKYTRRDPSTVSDRLMLDPFYVQLWSTPASDSVRVPVTPVQHTKLMHSVPRGAGSTSKKPSVTVDYAPADDGVLATAEEQVTEAPGGEISTALPTAPPAWQTLILDTVWRIHGEVMEALVAAQKEYHPPEKIQKFAFLSLDEAREKYPTDVEQFLLSNQHPNSSVAGTNTGTTAGFVAVVRQDLMSPAMVQQSDHSRTPAAPRCRIVGAIVYQFEWYRGSHQSAEASELIIHVHETTLAKSSAATRALGDPGGPILFIECANALDILLRDELVISWLRLILTILVLEQARCYHVWYATVPTTTATEQDFLGTYFGMIASAHDPSLLVCDLHQGSSKFSFLLFHEGVAKQMKLRGAKPSAASSSSCVSTEADNAELLCPKRRWLVRLPTIEEAKSAFILPTVSEHVPGLATGLPVDIQGRRPLPQAVPPPQYFTSADKSYRGSIVAIRAVMGPSDDDTKLHKLHVEDRSTGPEITTPTCYGILPSLDVVKKGFLLDLPEHEGTTPADKQSIIEDEIFRELTSKQSELSDRESALTSSAQKLLAKVVMERVDYESAAAISKREDELRILAESQNLINRRKELDEAWQQQLELDMDAVCEICADGEVTPDNQILFCEACNVAVHQMCYGIEQIPEGDYYCIACRRLGRESAESLHLAPKPLPIVCELCPIRQGAFIRTDIKPAAGEAASDKWVHVVCAKWLGLSFVNDGLQETIEDVTETRIDFRRHRIKCDLCQGERGGMNQCSHHSCKKFFHVTCARVVGTMSVTHGENCKGPVTTNAWQLYCEEHSDVKKIYTPRTLMSVESLVIAAKDFPPEPKPPPIPRPFNTLTGPERAELLADSIYERALIVELLSKRSAGVRCDVCDVIEEDLKTRTRCAVCHTTICEFCKVDIDEGRSAFRCKSCVFVERQRKNNEAFEVPQCSCCYQKGGLLREAIATPVSMTKWKKNPEQFKNSVFGKPIWTHSLCACWLPDLDLPKDTGIVDLSGVFLSDGRGLMINSKQVCFLCGQKGGLKMECDRPNCVYKSKNQKLVLHVTCARQAGFEVVADQRRVNKFGGPLCYVRCYRHGGNEHNLRAKLEDLFELEKNRAGDDLGKAHLPMSFQDAARLLKSAISVVRILGWAWRWAQFWVDYNSSWEPLLEKGQDERRMTDEELRIVHSTRESRCDDARKCRLAAFGAALRNRSYDTEDGFNDIALKRALRSILSTKSLVGPLGEAEREFHVEWLSRAYRSKSRLLCCGEDKNEISTESDLCVFSDKSPKFELGNRPLPGMQELAEGQVFEDVTEVDDFMECDPIGDERGSPRRRPVSSGRKRGNAIAESDGAVAANELDSAPSPRKRRNAITDADDTVAANTMDSVATPKKRGRPFKKKPIEDVGATFVKHEESTLSAAPAEDGEVKLSVQEMRMTQRRSPDGTKPSSTAGLLSSTLSVDSTTQASGGPVPMTLLSDHPERATDADDAVRPTATKTDTSSFALSQPSDTSGTLDTQLTEQAPCVNVTIATNAGQAEESNNAIVPVGEETTNETSEKVDADTSTDNIRSTDIADSQEATFKVDETEPVAGSKQSADGLDSRVSSEENAVKEKPAVPTMSQEEAMPIVELVEKRAAMSMAASATTASGASKTANLTKATIPTSSTNQVATTLASLTDSATAVGVAKGSRDDGVPVAAGVAAETVADNVVGALPQQADEQEPNQPSSATATAGAASDAASATTTATRDESPIPVYDASRWKKGRKRGRKFGRSYT